MRALQLPDTPGSVSGYDGDLSDDSYSGSNAPDDDARSDDSDPSYYPDNDVKTSYIRQPAICRVKSSGMDRKVSKMYELNRYTVFLGMAGYALSHLIIRCLMAVHVVPHLLQLVKYFYRKLNQDLTEAYYYISKMFCQEWV